MPGALPGEPTRLAYAVLRASVEARIGHALRGEAICALSCRRSGKDTESRVGELDPYAGRTVLAIFASREAYTIVWDGGQADVSRRQAYEAIPFD